MPKTNKMYVWRTNTTRGLPSTLQEVEYIESTGVQYINTGYKPNGNTKIACKFAHNENAVDTPVFGCRTSSSTYQYVLWSHPAGYTGTNGSNALFSAPSGWSGTVYAAILPKYNAGKVIEFEYDKSGGKYGDTTWTYSSFTTGAPNINMAIFGLQAGSSIDNRKFGGKIWYFKIWESGVLKRDFVPCYRKSDGVVGMYDLVSSTLYLNSGSGTFRKGKDIVSSEGVQVRPFTTVSPAYQQVEYIQSSATSPGSTSSSGQWIDTDVKITKDIKIEIDIQFTSTATQSRLFGCGYDSGSSGITFDAYINSSTQWARGTANGSGNRQTTNVSANTNRNKFVLDNSRYIIYNASGTQVYNATNSATITNSDTWTIPLLARINRGEQKVCQHSSAKLYGCKIWDGGVLLRNFVPCYRKSDSVIGLYDLVNARFYANAGTGTFTKGVDVDDRFIE